MYGFANTIKIRPILQATHTNKQKMATLQKIRSLIFSLAAIEMGILLFASLYVFGRLVVILHREDPAPLSTAVGLSGLAAALFLSAYLDVAWVVSFDDDYPLLSVAWVVKQFVQLFLVLSLAFYMTALSLGVYFFIPAGLIASQLVLWRIFIETRNAACECGGQCGERGYGVELSI